LGRLILQNDPIQETTLQGHADREQAQAERLAPGVRLPLVLLYPQFAIEGMQAAGHSTSRQEAPMRNRLVGETQGNIDQGLILDVRQARLVIGRAGASSIAEPLAFGRPLLLIPFGAAMEGHQDANARAMVEANAAISMREGELDGDRFTAQVNGLIDDPARLQRMANAARAAGRPQAAQEIARELLALGKCS